jgi:hypothetical protein
MLERAIGLAWCRDRSTVVVDVSNRGAGHRVPTGDVHRHASLKLWRSSAPEALRDSFFGRRYEPDPRGGKRIVWDSSLAPGESRRLRVEAAELAGEPDEPINLALVYVLTGDETPARHRDPGESTTRVVGSDRRRFSELPRCESPAPVTSR